jgi:DNA polymerase-3 subunit alpha
MIEKYPNYLSIHAGGVLVTQREITYHTALQMMPKGFPITHFDMYHAEDLGFHKYDVLSQRGLGHIKDAVDLIRINQGKAIDIHDVPKIKEDPQVKQQLYSGQCIGCFYIESPAMRGLLTKLHCDNYVHLVAASSIIRPGVAKSGMMREYIKRFHEPDKVEYLHPVFKENLGETFGVMVYQEDVMKIVHHFAGLDLDESDVLRRIMTGKKKSSDTFKRLMEKFWRNCRERQYPEELIAEVWRQVESFSGLFVLQSALGEFRGGKFSKPVSQDILPEGIHGWGDQQFRRILPDGILRARSAHVWSENRSAVCQSQHQSHYYLWGPDLSRLHSHPVAGAKCIPPGG